MPAPRKRRGQGELNRRCATAGTMGVERGEAR